MLSKACIALIFIIPFFKATASPITLIARNAVVWHPQQSIKGYVHSSTSKKVKWHLNDKSGFVNVHANGTFSFSVKLLSKDNIIWVEDADHSNIRSDTVHYTLGYIPLPQVKPFAVIKNNQAMLDLELINNPYNLPLKYHWKAEDCPAPVTIHNASKQEAVTTIPPVNGNYYFSVTVYAGNDSARYQTFITRTDKGLHAFDISNEYAAWIDSAIIYEITPNAFAKDGHYADITARLPEIKELGINTIWLQPIYSSHRKGQGYDVTDYFSLREDLGTEKELETLISTAKNLNLRVLFDFVTNHTSIFHPYAQEVIQYGDTSHYYGFYQHENDGAKYSSLYKIDGDGFVGYFWKELVNLDYDNIEVQEWITEALKYWLVKFDIDGYRLDAQWAVNARNPAFGRQLQTSLKSIKPGILLLAEDKGALHSVYKEGYDAAYDWTADSNWISSWSWATEYSATKNPTIFNFHDENKRSTLLNNALFNNGDTQHLRLRFLENNDHQAFILEHGEQRTKMASALLLALPGIPMIYNGQEIGLKRKPYSSKPVFTSTQTIRSLDSNNFFPWYKTLIELRMQHPALRSKHMKSLPVIPQSMFALRRWHNNENIIVLSNLTSEDANAEIDIHSLSNTSNRYIDLITQEVFVTNSNLTSLNVQMDKYSTRLLLAIE